MFHVSLFVNEMNIAILAFCRMPCLGYNQFPPIRLMVNIAMWRDGDKVFNSIQLNFIFISLNHHYSLKWLNRPSIYVIPLTQAPSRVRKKNHNQQRRNLGKKRIVVDPSFQGWSGVQLVPH